MTSDAGLFRLIGIVAWGYAGYALNVGRIWMSLWWSSREDSPFSFWFSFAAWVALGVVAFFMPELRRR